MKQNLWYIIPQCFKTFPGTFVQEAHGEVKGYINPYLKGEGVPQVQVFEVGRVGDLLSSHTCGEERLMIFAPGSIRQEYNFSLSLVLRTLLQNFLQEYLTVRYQNLLGVGEDTHVGTGDIGVIANGGNDLGGIVPQLPRMSVYGKIG